MQVHLDKLKTERVRLKEAREVSQEQLNQAKQGHHDMTCNLASARIAGKNSPNCALALSDPVKTRQIPLKLNYLIS